MRYPAWRLFLISVPALVSALRPTDLALSEGIEQEAQGGNGPHGILTDRGFI